MFVLQIFLPYNPAIGMTNPPVILRACMDRVTGEVTIYLKPSSDACNSFVFYNLRGRDDIANPFVTLTTEYTQSVTEIKYTLPNKKKWQLYLQAYANCLGDTLYSDTIFIDDTPPTNIEPDSVSIDEASQQVIAGWTSPPEPDVMGYSIFKVDPSNGNNILIDEQNVLSYKFTTATFLSTNGNNRMALAVYDSCRNGSLISNYHSPMLLTGAAANYKCDKNYVLSWTNYIGWNNQEYDILVKTASAPVWVKVATVAAGTNTYTYTIPQLGETYSFMVRVHKTGSTITSSSNKLVVTFADFIKASNFEIGHVSVLDDSKIEITGSYSSSTDLSEVLLQSKPTNFTNWSTLGSYPGNQGKFSYIDINKQAQNTQYSYRLVAKNICDNEYDTSKVHHSILLKRTYQNLDWNSYTGWASEAYEHNLAVYSKISFTWNTESTFPDSTYFIADTSKANCYRIIAIKRNNSGANIDTAYSNQICIIVFDTTLVPTAFTPEGLNPYFKIINPNLQPGQAIMYIYDRWGGKLFEGDALIGWDGKDTKGVYLGPGFYPYLIKISTIEKKSVEKGTIMLLR